MRRLYGQLYPIRSFLKLEERHLFLMLVNRLFKPFITQTKTLNFIITSKTEIRVFTPLLTYFSKDKNTFGYKVVVSNLSNHKIEANLLHSTTKSNNIIIQYDASFLIRNFFNQNVLNIICLDHTMYQRQHKLGVCLMKYIRKNKGKTVCVQHGGNQQDNIKGQSTSVSEFQIVFGKLMYDGLVNLGLNPRSLYLTGNPLHDQLEEAENVILSDSRKIISLITCLHTEYDLEEKPYELYYRFVKDIYESIDFRKYILIIKMHPYDDTENNIYKIVRNDLAILEKDLKIILSESKLGSVYSIIKSSDIIISRASSIIEESLMLNKKVVVYDYFSNGPSANYDHLLKYNAYTKIIGDPMLLKQELMISYSSEMISQFEIENIIFNTTLKLDYKSTHRVVKAFDEILAR